VDDLDAELDGGERSRIRAVCAPCGPEPTPRWTSGAGMPSSSKKTSFIKGS
jgi:hypothetical protein